MCEKLLSQIIKDDISKSIASELLKASVNDYKAQAKLNRSKSKQEIEMGNTQMASYFTGRAEVYDLVIIKLEYLNKLS